MPEQHTTWALIAGGGTAGHTLPGIAVARALVDHGHPAESIHFVGSERGSETRLVPAAGFTLTALPGRGIQRKLTLENVGAVVGLVRAFWHALKSFKRAGRGRSSKRRWRSAIPSSSATATPPISRSLGRAGSPMIRSASASCF